MWRLLPAHIPSLSRWLIDWCPVLRKLRFVKAETAAFAAACQASHPRLVWDFFRPFRGSGHHNGHITPLWVRQNTCQERSRLITVPVEVGGPLVTQCGAPIPSLTPCFRRRRLSKRASPTVHTGFPVSNVTLRNSEVKTPVWIFLPARALSWGLCRNVSVQP